MDDMVYNIPAALTGAYQGRKLIVRAPTLMELQSALANTNPEALVYVQLLSLPAASEDLRQWREPVPLDLILGDPAADFSHLYRCTPLLDYHPVRVTVPVVPGFGKAVKLAVSLQFAVKLEIAQPTPMLVEELAQALDLYLHQTTVTQPVEYFHSSLLAFLHQQPVSLWTIQEEDPTAVCYVTDQGQETLPGRLARIPVPDDSRTFLETLQRELLAAQSECSTCAFFAYCGGYFKWPFRDYHCDGVKTLFHTLEQAAAELCRDLATFSPTPGATPS